jgi:DNA polymerase-3 subunit alpha
LESLIKAGAMDEFGKRAAMLASLAKIMEESHQEQKRKSQGQTSLFDSEGTKAEESLADVDEFSREEILSFERELLGFYLTEHPLRPVISSLADKINFKISELPDQSGGTMVKIGGVITQVKKILTRQGNSEMAFIKIEDLTGTIEVIVFPKLYSQTKYIWVKDRVVIVWGKLDFKEDRPTILVEKVEELVY